MDNTNKYNEDLDLWSFFKKIGQFCVAIGNTLVAMVRITLSKLVFFSFMLLVGAGIGLAAYFLMKPVYITHMIIKSKFLNNDYCSQLTNTLDDLTDHDEDAPVLADKLHIPTKMAEQIKSIRFRNFSEKFEKLYKDSIAVDAPFKVEVKVHDPSILDSLQKGVTDYFEMNEFAQKVKAVKKDNFNLLKNKINEELQEIDSVKQLVNSSIVPRATGNGIIMGEPLDPVHVYQKAIDLYKNELHIHERLALIDNIEVVEGFTKFNKPHWPKLWLNMLLGAVAMYIIGIIWVSYKRKKDA